MPTATPKKSVDPVVVQKLADGWRYVNIPDRDPYDYRFDGVWINRVHYAPGRHLVSAEIADELEQRVEIWQRSMLRLMSNRPHRESIQQAWEGGQHPGRQDEHPPE